MDILLEVVVSGETMGTSAKLLIIDIGKIWGDNHHSRVPIPDQNNVSQGAQACPIIRWPKTCFSLSYISLYFKRNSSKKLKSPGAPDARTGAFFKQSP